MIVISEAEVGRWISGVTRAATESNVPVEAQDGGVLCGLPDAGVGRDMGHHVAVRCILAYSNNAEFV
jgi:hypothetical protein